MSLKKQLGLFLLVLVTGFAAAASAQTKKPAAKAKGRVFFIEPKNGDTVASPVHMKFGSEGIEIAAVPPGDVTTTRPGIGHYHIGIGVRCLASGKTIVKGTPSWVHFGDGKSEFDVQLTPGTHRIALQIGDDLHNTVRGFCQTITLHVK
ncbi:MAG: DUF4399 domain-containing protein [Acidobacteria bacterium]|nr:DUF4399 domain-containing protein [Acidobacteriota bacterium]